MKPIFLLATLLSLSSLKAQAETIIFSDCPDIKGKTRIDESKITLLNEHCKDLESNSKSESEDGSRGEVCQTNVNLTKSKCENSPYFKDNTLPKGLSIEQRIGQTNGMIDAETLSCNTSMSACEVACTAEQINLCKETIDKICHSIKGETPGSYPLTDDNSTIESDITLIETIAMTYKPQCKSTENMQYIQTIQKTKVEGYPSLTPSFVKTGADADADGPSLGDALLVAGGFAAVTGIAVTMNQKHHAEKEKDAAERAKNEARRERDEAKTALLKERCEGQGGKIDNNTCLTTASVDNKSSCEKYGGTWSEDSCYGVKQNEEYVTLKDSCKAQGGTLSQGKHPMCVLPPQDDADTSPVVGPEVSDPPPNLANVPKEADGSSQYQFDQSKSSAENFRLKTVANLKRIKARLKANPTPPAN